FTRSVGRLVDLPGTLVPPQTQSQGRRKKLARKAPRARRHLGSPGGTRGCTRAAKIIHFASAPAVRVRARHRRATRASTWQAQGAVRLPRLAPSPLRPLRHRARRSAATGLSFSLFRCANPFVGQGDRFPTFDRVHSSSTEGSSPSG